MKKFFDQNKLLSIAHRGGAGVVPENTLPAFREALRLYRADAIEMDLHISKDGHPVVIHDNTVDRTTDGKGLVENLTLDEIKRLDAGWSFTPDNGATYPWRGKGLEIPTLKEVLKAFQSEWVGINIEVKTYKGNIASKLYNMIVSHGMADRCLISSPYTRVMNQFNALNKRGIATGADKLEGIKAYLAGLTGFDALYKPKADALQVPYKYKGFFPVLTPRLAEFCKRKGIKLHIWTVNDTLIMRKLKEMGVDGIITDYPDRLLMVLDEYRHNKSKENSKH